MFRPKCQITLRPIKLSERELRRAQITMFCNLPSFYELCMSFREVVRCTHASAWCAGDLVKNTSFTLICYRQLVIFDIKKTFF